MVTLTLMSSRKLALCGLLLVMGGCTQGASRAYQIVSSKMVQAAGAYGFGTLCLHGLEKERRVTELRDAGTTLSWNAQNYLHARGIYEDNLYWFMSVRDLGEISSNTAEKVQRKIAMLLSPESRGVVARSFVQKVDGRTYVVLSKRDRRALEGEGSNGLKADQVLAFLEREDMMKDPLTGMTGKIIGTTWVPTAAVVGRCLRLAGRGRLISILGGLGVGIGSMAAFSAHIKNQERKGDEAFATDPNKARALAGYYDIVFAQAERQQRAKDFAQLRGPEWARTRAMVENTALPYSERVTRLERLAQQNELKQGKSDDNK